MNNMMGDKKVLIITLLVAGALVGAGSAYVGMNQGGVSKQKAAETVANTLSDQTGVNHEVVNVEEANGLYKVQLNQNNQLQTYYVTKDGKMVTGQMTDLEQVQQTIETQNNVQECLNNENAVLYGNLTQQPTQLQIQVLGGPRKVAGYYKDINNPSNLREAAVRGVTSVPTLWLNNRTLSNVNNLQSVSEFASCE